jgi:hypothetical protein
MEILQNGSVLALAGRRVDPPGADVSRFPLANVPAVRARLASLFNRLQPKALVCSAACGADLVALQVAEAAQMDIRVVLPFEAERFRKSSVVDRPGEWGEPFDRIVARAAQHGGLIVLDDAGEAEDAYARVNVRILDEALRMAGKEEVDLLALAVWDGRSRGEGDLTEAFMRLARERGIAVSEVPTLNDLR